MNWFKSLFSDSFTEHCQELMLSKIEDIKINHPELWPEFEKELRESGLLNKNGKLNSPLKQMWILSNK